MPVHFPNHDGTRKTIFVLLRRERGHWGIYGVRNDLPGSRSMILDFEEIAIP